jgi:hypothetical protein
MSSAPPLHQDNALNAGLAKLDKEVYITLEDCPSPPEAEVSCLNIRSCVCKVEWAKNNSRDISKTSSDLLFSQIALLKEEHQPAEQRVHVRRFYTLSYEVKVLMDVEGKEDEKFKLLLEWVSCTELCNFYLLYLFCKYPFISSANIPYTVRIIAISSLSIMTSLVKTKNCPNLYLE